MQLRAVTPGAHWRERVEWAYQNSRPYLPDWWAEMNDASHVMWELTEDNSGGEFNEVTETVDGGPLLAVVVVEAMVEYGPAMAHVVVDPDHRRRGLGTLLLKWVMRNYNSQLMATVQAGDYNLGFSLQRGGFQSATVNAPPTQAGFLFIYDLAGRAWPHGTCRCLVCEEGLSSLTSRPSRRRPARARRG